MIESQVSALAKIGVASHRYCRERERGRETAIEKRISPMDAGHRRNQIVSSPRGVSDASIQLETRPLASPTDEIVYLYTTLFFFFFFGIIPSSARSGLPLISYGVLDGRRRCPPATTTSKSSEAAILQFAAPFFYNISVDYLLIDSAPQFDSSPTTTTTSTPPPPSEIALYAAPRGRPAPKSFPGRYVY